MTVCEKCASSEQSFFQMFLLPAGPGDCIWLEYGPVGKRQRILIDGGTVGSWGHLEKRIKKLPQNERHFDLLVVSHIDNDHIGGALALLEKRRHLGVTFGEIWFNDRVHLPQKMLGVKKAQALSKLIRSNPDLKKIWNTSFQGAAVAIPASGPLPMVCFGGLHLTVLSPGPAELLALANNWDDEVKEFERRQRLRGADMSKMLGGTKNLTPPPDVFGDDKSPTNGSSIAVLAEFGSVRVLLAADAFAHVLAESLRRVQAAGQVRLDAFKLSHHGSGANISTDLLSILSCRNFLMSANGTHGHPEVRTLKMISEREALSRFHFNYEVAHTKDWLDSRSHKPGTSGPIYLEPTDYEVSL